MFKIVADTTMRAPHQIRASFSDFTRAQQKIAEFVIEHGDEVVFMTAKQLAAAVGQSDAAVVRFAKAAGYTGYVELRDSLRVDILDSQGSSGMQAQVAGATDAGRLRQEVQSVSTELIAKTFTLNPDEAFEVVVKAFIGARRIFVSGHGTSYPLAAYMTMHLNQCFDKVQLLNVEHGDLAERFRSVGPMDVVVGIGYVRYLPYTIDILKHARKVGVTVVAITDKMTSPLAAVADHTLYAARSSSPIWWSQAGTLAIVDALSAMCMSRDPQTADRLRKSDEMLRMLGHWKGSIEGA